MDWGLVASGASVAISTVGTVIALRQAGLAKRAAEVSTRAADASAAQALAAIEQANLLRRQMTSEAGDRDRREAPVFALRMVDEGEWGSWQKTRGGGRHFVTIAKNNTPSVQDWVKRRILILSHQNGPPVSASIQLHGESSSDAEVLVTGPFDMVEGSSEQVPLVTAYHLEGAELVVVIVSREVAGHRREWIAQKSIGL